MSQPLFDLPNAPVRDETAQLLDLIAGDPLHRRDRERIVRAVIAEAHHGAGRVDQNRVRARLTNENGDLTVTPQVIGATIAALRCRGVLVKDGWDLNLDRKGGNYGKPLARYRMTRTPEVAA